MDSLNNLKQYNWCIADCNNDWTKLSLIYLQQPKKWQRKNQLQPNIVVPYQTGTLKLIGKALLPHPLQCNHTELESKIKMTYISQNFHNNMSMTKYGEIQIRYVIIQAYCKISTAFVPCCRMSTTNMCFSNFEVPQNLDVTFRLSTNK